MRADQRDRVFAAADQAAIALNGIGLIESMQGAHRIFTKLAERVAEIQTKEQVIAILDSAPDLSLKDEKLYRACCRFFPQLFRVGVMTFASKVKESLPAIPTGRRRVLGSTEEQQVCEFIGSLILAKVSVDNAVMRASQRFGGSERTIRRTWSERDKIAANLRDPDFAEILQAVTNYLAEN